MADGSTRAPPYVPKPHEGTRLARLVGATLPQLEATAERTLGRALPPFVARALSGFANCGDYARGFVRMRCGACTTERYVAFTCKGRIVCASCGGRRMTQLAAHLLDAVLPHAPVRQWVLTVPFGIRARLAFDPVLAREIRRALAAALDAHYRARAGDVEPHEVGTGAVTAVQRFGSGLNLHVHLHTLALDGAFVGDVGAGERLRFLDAGALSAADVGDVLVDLVARLEARGTWTALPEDEDQLTCHELLGEASMQRRIALGPRRGQPVERVGAHRTLIKLELDGVRPKARFAGFDLEAGTRVGRSDRYALERLCRYILRPALAESRLSFDADGKVTLALKSRWPDGTTHLRFTPLEIVEKLAALVPRPHENLVVYHGIFAGNAKHRAAFVAYGRPDPPEPRDASGAESASPRVPARLRRDFATLMKRGLGIDVFDCPTCHGRMRIVALIDDPRLAAPVAARLGLARTRAGPADLPRTDLADRYVEYDEADRYVEYDEADHAPEHDDPPPSDADEERWQAPSDD